MSKRARFFPVTYVLLAATNPALPASKWELIQVLSPRTSGVYWLRLYDAPTNPQRFYQLRCP